MINRADGDRLGIVLGTFRWEKDVVPQIGPGPQHVIDEQTPACDIYVGVLSGRFGTPTEGFGSRCRVNGRPLRWSGIQIPDGRG
ncbi:MAG: hypothetical protein ACLQNE_14400 [Thermoguttaceae bacterium]